MPKFNDIDINQWKESKVLTIVYGFLMKEIILVT
jgi:hypothetical protein